MRKSLVAARALMRAALGLPYGGSREAAVDRDVVARRNRPTPARTWPSKTVRNATIADFLRGYEGWALQKGPRDVNTYRFIRREKAKEAYRRAGR